MITMMMMMIISLWPPAASQIVYNKTKKNFAIDCGGKGKVCATAKAMPLQQQQQHNCKLFTAGLLIVFVVVAVAVVVAFAALLYNKIYLISLRCFHASVFFFNFPALFKRDHRCCCCFLLPA